MLKRYLIAACAILLALSGCAGSPSPKAEDAGFVGQTPQAQRAQAEEIAPDISHDVAIGRYGLPGTLVVPEGGQKIVALLLWGSGPQDRDETVPNSDNKFLRDLAEGLSAQGIASLRFDKRTFAAPPQFDMANITLEGEYYEDTKDAIKLLGSRLPSHKIFIVAHSQGATLVPDLLKRNPSVVGAVAMAGTPRNLFELIFDQQMHQLNVQQELSENDREKKIAEAKKVVAKMRAISSPDDQVPPPFSGMLNAAYAVDLNRLDPIETAKELTAPMLFLQGESDQQVYLDPDFRAWQEALSGQEGVEFKSFPKLNHFFWETQGLPPLEDIAAPNKVSPEVITEISRWLTRTA